MKLLCDTCNQFTEYSNLRELYICKICRIPYVRPIFSNICNFDMDKLLLSVNVEYANIEEFNFLGSYETLLSKM